MANADYTLTINKLLKGEIDFDEETVVAYLVNVSGEGTTYTPDFDTDEFLEDISSGAIIAGPVTLTNLTVNGRYIDADNPVFTSVSSELPSIEAMVLVIQRNDETDSPLLLFMDTATGLPATPNGGNIEVQFNAAGIWGIGAPSA